MSADDPAVQSLAEKIRRQGLLQPIVITRDNVIVSGHRRRVASMLAGLTSVPCRVIDMHSTDALEDDDELFVDAAASVFDMLDDELFVADPIVKSVGDKLLNDRFVVALVGAVGVMAVIPPDELEMLLDNIGIPNSWPAIAQGDIPTISSADGEILIAAILLVANWPYTLIVIRPTNNKMMQMNPDVYNDQVRPLITRWGRLHALRTVLGFLATIVILLDVLTPPG